MGFRNDLGVEWSFPAPSHSQDSLLYDKWVSGDYWERNRVAHSERPDLPERHRCRVMQLRGELLPPDGAPWVTVREAMDGLPDPRDPDASRTVAKSKVRPGARTISGAPGGPLDEPPNAKSG